MTPLEEAAGKLARAAIGLQKRRAIDRIAAKHRPRLSAFFRKQKALALEKFKGYQFLFTEEYRALREEIRPNEFLTTHDWDRLWQEIDRDTFDELQRIIAGVESDGVQNGGDQLRNLINPGGKFWDLANPRAVAWFQRTGGTTQYIANVQRTTQEGVKTIISKAIDEGWSYGQTAKEISSKFDDFSRDRTQRIAVFESGQAYEAGNRMFAESLKDDGIQMEQHWMTSHDAKVRPEHAANEDEGWVPMDHTFSSGDTKPPTDLGCRCYMVYRAAEKRE